MKSIEQQVIDWISKITCEKKFPENYHAICIGLFESDTNYTAYFLGAREYTPNNDDWACADEDTYYPKNKYLDTGISTDNDWEKLQDEMVMIIRKIMKNENSILSKVDGVAVGFDSGELIYIK